MGIYCAQPKETGVSNLNTSLLARRFYHISLDEPQMKTPVREALVGGEGVALQVPVFRIKTDRNDRDLLCS